MNLQILVYSVLWKGPKETHEYASTNWKQAEIPAPKAIKLGLFYKNQINVKNPKPHA